MNMTFGKRKDAVQDDIEHAILRPKTLMVYNTAKCSAIKRD